MPSTIRLFVLAPLSEGGTVAATAAQAHHLAIVMRCRPGDQVRLFNGRDGEWSGRIATLRRDRMTLIVQQRLRPQVTEADLWLAFALLKRDATDLVVQKATELGVAAFLPVMTARTNAARVNLDRLVLIATEAAEQAGRLTVPALRAPQRLHELLASWPAERPLLAALERSDAPPVPAIAPAGLLVGPEGGFTTAERETLLARPFVQPVSFGRLVLRAETACIAGLALLQVPRRP
jgi:16S rRNA (uracil1498-N3)-methyltransferase